MPDGCSEPAVWESHHKPLSCISEDPSLSLTSFNPFLSCAHTHIFSPTGTLGLLNQDSKLGYEMDSLTVLLMEDVKKVVPTRMALFFFPLGLPPAFATVADIDIPHAEYTFLLVLVWHYQKPHPKDHFKVTFLHLINSVALDHDAMPIFLLLVCFGRRCVHIPSLAILQLAHDVKPKWATGKPISCLFKPNECIKAPAQNLPNHQHDSSLHTKCLPLGTSALPDPSTEPPFPIPMLSCIVVVVFQILRFVSKYRFNMAQSAWRM